MSDFIKTKQFDLTEKQIRFILSFGRKYFMEDNPEVVFKKGPANCFIALSNAMLESNDPEIKIDLSRALMFMGFMEVVGKIIEASSKDVVDLPGVTVVKIRMDKLNKGDKNDV